MSTTYPDNFEAKIASVGEDHLLKALNIFFGVHHSKAAGYKVITLGDDLKVSDGISHSRKGQQALVLYWVGDVPNGVIPFPAELSAEEALPIVQKWLNAADMPKCPDMDGDIEPGFIVYCESWGHVDGDGTAICGITPMWAMYGK